MKHAFPPINRLIFLCAVLPAALISCARMPALTPVRSDASADMEKTCAMVFPHGNWQFVHTIETVMAGRRGTVIGVSVISERSRTIRSALMSLEGFVMFEATDRNGTITIDRAVPPFDRPNFARGMLDDIRLIFFQPGPRPDDTGFTSSKTAVCRYSTGPEQTVDVAVEPYENQDGPKQWTLRRYDRGDLVRTVQADAGTPMGPRNDRIPRRLHLEAKGARGYTLDLNLIEAVPLADRRNP